MPPDVRQNRTRQLSVLYAWLLAQINQQRVSAVSWLRGRAAQATRRTTPSLSGELQHTLHVRLIMISLAVVGATMTLFALITVVFGPPLYAWLLQLVAATYAVPLAGDSSAANGTALLAALTQALMLGTGVATVTVVALSLVVSVRIIRPLQRLLASSRRLAAGAVGEQAVVEHNDEIGALAAQINSLAAELREMDRRMTVVIGDVAHELRTPLATIDGYIEGLIDGIVTPGPATYTLLHHEVGRLRRMVQDLQEVTRNHSSQLPLRLQLVRPGELVERALECLRSHFAAHAVTVTIDLAANLPVVRADPDRIVQVLINLLGNALDHTPSGGQVTLRVTSSDEVVCFRVADTGAGIAAADLPLIFERFYRAQPAARSITGGSGVGLTIARALVLSHGGIINATSAGPGHGATFEFTLPRQRRLIA